MEISFNSLSVVGVNFHKTALEVRSKFAFSAEQLQEIYNHPSTKYTSPFFILSSCNRTEAYSINASPEELIDVLAFNGRLSREEVKKHVFIKQGEEVMRHVFRVASGLDSQIIGDYEITGQLKNAFALAKASGRTDGYLEKMVNTALQISKRIKNETALSDGTTSVSYAAIQMLKQMDTTGAQIRVCLLGLGKIGGFTLKNLRDYLPNHQVTLVNRNQAKAEAAAAQYGVAFAPLAEQYEVLKNSDVVIVATGAAEPIIYGHHLESTPVKMVFDLSVPNNVHPEVGDMEQLRLYNIDEVSQIVNDTIAQRRNEIPKAEMIINEHFYDLIEWHNRRLLYLSQKPLL